MKPEINPEGSEKPTKYITLGEWEGQPVQIVADTMCTGHALEPVDHYGEPTQYLMCFRCRGITTKP